MYFQIVFTPTVKHVTQQQIVKPYILRSLLLWACDRVKLHHLSKEECISETMLGLMDDMLQCLVSRSCPNYFIPQYNMIGHLDDETVLKLCQVVLMVRWFIFTTNIPCVGATSFMV